MQVNNSFLAFSERFTIFFLLLRSKDGCSVLKVEMHGILNFVYALKPNLKVEHFLAVPPQKTQNIKPLQILFCLFELYFKLLFST